MLVFATMETKKLWVSEYIYIYIYIKAIAQYVINIYDFVTLFFKEERFFHLDKGNSMYYQAYIIA